MPKMTAIRKPVQKASVVPSRAFQRQSKPAVSLHPVLRLQQTAGNQAVGQLIQAKLKVGQPGDKYEQEADRVADQVMRMPMSSVQRQVEPEEEEEESLQAKSLSGQITGHPLQRKCAACASGQGLCPNCAGEEEGVQRKPLASTASPLIQRQRDEKLEDEEGKTLRSKTVSGQTSSVSSDVKSHIQSLRGRGQPLPDSARAFFEPRFGYDFSQVRLHTGTQAAESARTVNARAFTVGRDVVFGSGQYAPETVSGKKLLAHELTHVVQQGDRRHLSTAGISVGPPGNIFEQEAEAVTEHVGSGATFDTPPVTSNWTKTEPVLHRTPDECPPEREEEPDHLGACPEIERERGELGRFRPVVETVAVNECYLITGMASAGTEFGVPTELNDVADLLMLDPTVTVHITGYTDCLGPAALNANLRALRAAAVEDYLINLGVDQARIFIDPVSSTEYVATNSTAEGRARNRGVAIYLQSGSPARTPEPAPPPNPDLEHGDIDAVNRERQRSCLWRLGGCPESRSAGVLDPEMLRGLNERCRRETGYTGPDLSEADIPCGQGPPPMPELSDDQCARQIAQSLGSAWLGRLPDCPCTAPDPDTTDWSESNTGIGCFHPGANNCFRVDSGTHAQQCCYDRSGQLITEGAAAGTPDFFSSSNSFDNHQMYDVWPWTILGWERYNRFWIPNNDMQCPTNSVSGTPDCAFYHTILASRPDRCSSSS